MMKLKLLIVLIVMGAHTIYAQQADFINTIEKMVLNMRDHPGKKAYWDETVATLSEPNQPMVALLDNLAADDQSMEYHKADAEPMHINGAITKAFDARKGKVTSKGDFYNSLSRGINYSAVEKTIKGNSTVTYRLSGHHGAQNFIVIPYDAAKSTVDITYYVDGKEQTSTTEISKISRCNIKTLEKGVDVTIKVTNTGQQPQTVVIINHNAKK